MPVEEGEFISDFVPSNPLETDFKSEAPQHFELLKQWIQNTFPNINDAVTISPDEMNNAGMPIGSMCQFAGSAPPLGYSVCDGRSVLITSFPELYEAIGDVWGTTGGAVAPEPGYFRFPNGEINGQSNYLKNEIDGILVGVHEVDSIKEHTHNLTLDALTSSSNGSHTHTVTSTQPAHKHSNSYAVSDSFPADNGVTTVASRTGVGAGNSRTRTLDTGNATPAITTTAVANGAHTHSVTPTGSIANNGTITKPHSISVLLCIRSHRL